ncbi:linear amide C-N hydrolase [Acidobacteriota bacterium]
MKRSIKTGLLCTVLAILVSMDGLACTTFCLNRGDTLLFGRNYDWSVEDGLVLINKRNVLKTSISAENPAKWRSRYGSITFNQYGRELPMGGMNEKGLVIECMWLQGTTYPKPDDRPQLGELQWIQYQLDTASTVKEVIRSDKAVRIDASTAAPIHFLACDRKGDCATIEFLNGKMTAHTGRKLDYPVLANSTYRDSTRFVRTCEGGESSEVFKSGDNSLHRFFRAAEKVKASSLKDSGPPVDNAFSVLKRVSMEMTLWSIVYDVRKGRIFFKTKANQSIRFMDIDDFDFTCGTPVKVFDMAAGKKGEISGDFEEYTTKANYDLINASFSGTNFLKDTPDEIRRNLSRYPEGLACAP